MDKRQKILIVDDAEFNRDIIEGAHIAILKKKMEIRQSEAFQMHGKSRQET
mgnify:CR=1 FL=1